MAKFWQNAKSIIRGFSPILGNFKFQLYYEVLISLECAVDSECNDVINFIVSCLVVELFIEKEITKNSHQWPDTMQNISITVHATTKLFVPFCSAQDGKSTDMNCLVFWAYCKNDKILAKQ